MTISKLENFQKGKVKIYLTNVPSKYYEYINSSNYFCFLYTKELPKYKIKLDEELSEESFEKILSNLKDRTKNKAEAILMRASKTKKALYDKLIMDGYNHYLSKEIVDDFETKGYINDKYFAENYIESNKNKKSIKVIKMTLIQKGIDREIINELLEDEDDKQEKLVKALIDKKLKGRNWDDLDFKEKNKIKAYLYSKGFKFEGFGEDY